MKIKKVPIRKCVACGLNKPKKELLRIVNNKEEGIVVDSTGKKNGRGAYLCKDLNCIKLVTKNNKLDTALNTKIDNNIYKEIIDYVKNSK